VPREFPPSLRITSRVPKLEGPSSSAVGLWSLCPVSAQRGLDMPPPPCSCPSPGACGPLALWEPGMKPRSQGEAVRCHHHARRRWPDHGSCPLTQGSWSPARAACPGQVGKLQWPVRKEPHPHRMHGHVSTQ